MKKFICLLAVLTLILSFSSFSYAQNCIDELDFEFSDNRVTLENVRIPTMIFDQTIKNCTSLTYNYWVSDEGAGRWVLYYKNEKGEWHRGKDFTIDKDNVLGSVKLDFVLPITFNELAVFKISRYGFNFTYYYVAFTDVYCDNGTSSTPNTPAPSKTTTSPSSGSGNSSYDDIGFYFGNSTEIMGTSTQPIIFNEKIKNCKSFNFDYRLTNDTGAGRWVAYYKNGSNDIWNKLKDFTIDEDHLEGSVKMTFNSPTTFDRLAICKTSRYGFDYTVYISFSDFNCN